MLSNVLRRTHEAFCRIPVCSSSRCAKTMSSKPHVGVIGAGLSGLRCADLLIRNGVQVTILEARDRIGGRVREISTILGGGLIPSGCVVLGVQGVLKAYLYLFRCIKGK